VKRPVSLRSVFDNQYRDNAEYGFATPSSVWMAINAPAAVCEGIRTPRMAKDTEAEKQK